MPYDIDWEVRLGFLIHDVSRLRRQAFDRYLKPHNITRSQWWLVVHLSRDKRARGMTQSELADEMDLGKVAIGGLIDRLEKSGLVERRPDPNDRRVNRIFLTDKGRGLLATIGSVNHDLNEQMLEKLSDKEADLAATLLAKMKVNLLKICQSEMPEAGA